jgi:hypothetical protein
VSNRDLHICGSRVEESLDVPLLSRRLRREYVWNFCSVPHGMPRPPNVSLSKRCTRRLVQLKYLNNLVEQDHRFIKRLTKLGLGFFSLETSWRTLQGYEVMHMMSAPGRARW